MQVGEVEVRRGTRVILRPGVRRADAYDLFLAGRTATVAAVLLRRRPRGATSPSPSTTTPAPTSRQAHGRYLYFAPDEVEPLGPGDVVMTPPVLVACVGNIFKCDDGFGVEVAAAWRGATLPDGVRVVDFGIRSVHLVYELLAGYDVLVLVDTVAQQDGPPGLAVRDRAGPPARVVRRRRCPR